MADSLAVLCDVVLLPSERTVVARQDEAFCRGFVREFNSGYKILGVRAKMVHSERELHRAQLIEGEISLKKATELLPRKEGKKFHKNTLKRWHAKGLKGPNGERIKLVAWRRGIEWFTTAEHLEEFTRATTSDQVMVRPRTERQRRAAAEAARARLHSKGFYGRKSDAATGASD